MAYVALYRKWRPAVFDDVKGQEPIVTTLKNQIAADRAAHAYLFCGSRGTGKTSVAKIFAKAVNCLEPVGGEPCGHCAVCRAIEEGSSMNVVEIDAASNNGVDNIRQIRDEVQYSPTEGRYRVYIIDEVHMLSSGAFNALLKTLEEPPSYVIFILATTEPHKVPVTVLSRCQRYDFRRIPMEDIESRIRELAEKEQLQIEDKAIAYIARKADGGMRDALSLLDKCVSYYMNQTLTYEKVLEALGTVDLDVFSRFLRALLQDDTTEALKAIEETLMSGRELGQFVQDFVWYMRNLLLLMTSKVGNEQLDMTKEDWMRSLEESRMTSPEELIRLIRLFSELYNQMRNAVNKRVLLEVAAIKATRPVMERGTEALSARISLLEKKLAKGIVVQGAPAEVKPEPEPAAQKQVEIPKAQWEDLQKVREQWRVIMGSVQPQQALAMEGVTLEPRGEGRICIVFYDQMRMNMAESFSVLKAAEKYVRENMNREITFEARLAGQDEPVSEYISDDELEAIHGEFEIEN